MACLAALFLSVTVLGAGPLRPVPRAWKWVSATEAVFSYDGTYADSACFSLRFPAGRKGAVRRGSACAPERFRESPVQPAGAENLTWSPDSSRLAFTRGGNLYVVLRETGVERALTTDGNELILNGYASWVYYEEIFGRPSRYRAFWWSPDGRRLAFYRFDNTQVPLFPIYSPFGQDGRLLRTRYPKAGERNPEVRIGMVDVTDPGAQIVWADFDPAEDQYFGTPFWGRDGKTLFVSREPRRQNVLDLYAVDAASGRKRAVYHEEVPTWLDWCEGMLFGEKGLYMVRDFETGWQQVYYLSYDGRELRRLTDGRLWRIRLLHVDEEKDAVCFTAHRDGSLHTVLWRSAPAGRAGRSLTALTDTSLSVSGVRFSPDGARFAASQEGWQTPPRVVAGTVSRPKETIEVADSKPVDFKLEDYAIPQRISLRTTDGLTLPGFIVLPFGFDPGRKYPVHFDLYGGPDTPLVRDRWYGDRFRWWAEQGIIEVTADCRAAGHNGRRGLDAVYRNLGAAEAADFVAWARRLKELPYVDGKRLGVEGFSFGGTMTALLVMDHPEDFPYGIAGGGVYDWALYDTHYTERFMDTPQANPEGYARARVLNHAAHYRARYDTTGVAPVMLKLTHGTGDDNVHFQHTLQLVDTLQRQGACFELMIYPDALHGYRGAQGRHATAADRAFWLHYLRPDAAKLTESGR